ncbi:MAG: MFS transporter [SAR202 cluster bacterium]|nr:MFS transporter [SAR202 cluster bacterium]
MKEQAAGAPAGEGGAGRPAGPGATAEFVSLPRRQVLLTMGGLMLALFLAALDQTVVGTAMPRIVGDLGGFDKFTWITSAYIVASTTVVPIVGRLSDLYGRKLFYILAIVIFLVTSVLAGFSQTMNQLIFFRALQGIGGGAIMALAFVSIGDLFPPAERGKYQGIISAVFGLSSVIGPTLGGFITDNISWHWVFFINLPLGIPIVALFVKYFPSSHISARKAPLDIPGVVLLILSIVPVMLGLSMGGVQYEWSSPIVIGLVAISAVAVVLFIIVESRAKDPIMPLGIYKNPVVSLSLLIMFCVGFGMFGGIVFVPLYFQGVLGASATSSGSFLTPMMLGVVFGAALSGQALSRFGGRYRLQGLVGLSIMATGIFLLSRMTPDTSYGLAVLNIILMGFGMGTTFPTFTIAVQNAVPHSFLGVATSATQFYRSIGGSLGLAILGAYMTNRFTAHLADTLSPAVREAVPAEQISEIAGNPQAMVGGNALAALQERFAGAGPQGAELAQQMLTGLRLGLSHAISDVFTVSLATVVVGLFLTYFIKEVPLRGRGPVSGGHAEI